MTHQAKGDFEVKLAPQSLTDSNADPSLGRMSLDKKFSGDLDAVSRGEMLSAMGTEKGSGVYVAIERVSGTLQGKHGSFAMYHVGTMQAGKQELSVQVAPDSGTGQLVGLTGRMQIIIEGRKHSYVFDYALPE
jgi:phosphatidylserine decarboxylase